jgi:superfamily I DNA and RNA helicase
MPIEFIPARIGQASGPATELIQQIRERSEELGIADGIMYYGWPKFTDYEAVRHFVDIAIISRKTGILLIRILPAANQKQINDAAESISQVTATAIAQLVRSPLLRTRSRELKVNIVPALFAPGYGGARPTDVEFFNSEGTLVRFIQDLNEEPLSPTEFEETRSILEGAKALVRLNRRTIDDPAHQKFAVAVSKLEDEIASFDQRQRHVALSALGCPERIR